LEANIGFDQVRASADYEDTAFPEDNFSGSAKTNGFLLGASIGYDVPIGPVYLGVEAIADIPINKRCEPVYGDDAACFKTQGNFAVGGRVGVAVSRRALEHFRVALSQGF